MRSVLSIAAMLAAAPLVCAQAAAPSLLDQPPAAPVVSFAGGKLTIQAANSSLRAILDVLQARTGATVEGFGKDERIFGVYGPGAPQEVLSALLDDSGYNVLIAGKRPDGAPREVVLSARDAAASNGAPAGQPTQAAQDADDGSDQAEQVQPPQPALFGPGGVGGQGFPQPQPNAQNGQNGQPVKTPQQLLDELQRLRQTQPPQ